jgi:hypothetical protein
MNNKVRAFIIGGTVGAVAGYLIGTMIVTRMSVSISEDFELENGEGGEEDEDDEAQDESSSRVFNLLGKMKKDESKYTDYVKMYMSDQKPPIEELARKYSKNDPGNFVTLTQEEYEQRLVNDQAVSEVTYYTKDTIFADENDKIITDVEDLIGENVLNSFGDKSNDPDIVYIHDLTKNIAYEVTRLNAAYYGTVVESKEVEPIRRRGKNWEG